MELKTKFALGDKVFVLKNGKIREIEIKSITFDENGVWYDDTEAFLVYQPHHERQCFATKDELVAYITSDD